MLSLRSFTRAVPRSFSSVSAQCSRQTLTTVRRSSLLQQSTKLVSRQKFVAFSTSRSVWAQKGQGSSQSEQAVWAEKGQVDQELAAKLQSELELEKGMRDSEKLPANLQDYLDRSDLNIKDVAGQDRIVLTRQFGDELIKISFSIADVVPPEQDPDTYADDKAQFDEDESDLADTQSGGAQSKGTIAQGRTKDRNFNAASVDGVAPGDRLELGDDELANADEEQRPGFPARVDVTIEKGGKGALRIETLVQDGQVLIDKVAYYPKPEIADAQTAEMEWANRDLHTGPPFGNLDEDLQLLMERYLDERGVNAEFALWIPEYIDFKEQREYLKWLSNVKSFVDA
ncbi:hypothetical protein MMC29_007674 [Sticta canariensis]|nr:hypothetical protein [Sticta canariensis]